ncbi:class I SAM-dependent methyltransferase [Roseibium sp.]|uniref:class I SAM-dependent methyltransferase n=1 Tax=Roseibium sp. TaxID=1936156 RepID=UPI003A97403B
MAETRILPASRRAFIQAETRIKPVPHAEEIRLHLADEAMDLWQKTEDELGELGLPPPFWAFAWAGGQAISRHVLDHPELVAGKKVLDFASGSGIVGIAAMLAGAASCLAVDVDPFAIEAGKLNAEINGVTIAFEQGDITDAPLPTADLVFCGDVFYDKPMADRIIAFLDRLLADGIPVMIGDPGRSYLPRERLEHLATYRVPVVGALEDAEVKSSSVYEFKTNTNYS